MYIYIYIHTHIYIYRYIYIDTYQPQELDAGGTVVSFEVSAFELPVSLLSGPR